MIRTFALAMICAAIAGCGASGHLGSSSKTNNIPLVLNLQATPQEAWVGQPVAFNVTCLSAKGAAGNANLTYQWHFGDESSTSSLTAPSSVASDVHVYTLAAGATGSNQYDAYEYYVVCQDNSFDPPVTARTPSQSLNVLRQNLDTVALGTCSSGVQGVGWCWQNPTPTGATLRALAALTPLNAWAVGDSGTVLETYDGGATWQVKFLGRSANGTLPNLYAIKAVDQNNAHVLGGDGTFWNTTSAGASWTTTQPSSPVSLSNGVMIDANHAWAAGDTGLATTSNGGASWSTIPTPGHVSVVTALDTQNIFAAGLSFETDTSDAGKTWSTPVALDASILGTGTDLVDVMSISATRGSRCGNTDSIAVAESVWIGAHLIEEGEDPPERGTGLSWPRAASPAVPTFNSEGSIVSAFDGRTAWAGEPVVYPGGISYTTNGTGNWQGSSSASLNPYTFDTPDCQTGWAAGSGGAISNTKDGAVSWLPQLPATDAVGGLNLVSVSSGSALQVFALGESTIHGHLLSATSYGIYSTLDGMHWTSLGLTSLGDGGGPGSISANEAGQFVAVSGSYLVISYGGPNAVANESPITNGALKAVSLSGTLAWIVGVTGGTTTTVWRLDINDTTTWNLMPPTPQTSIPVPATASLNGIAALSPSSAVAVGAQGAIYRLGYTGSSWQVKAVVSPATSDLNAVSLTPSGSGWVVGQGGSILRTTDGGQTWKSQNWSDPTVNFSSVSSADGESGWVVGQNADGAPTVLYTCNGGNTWIIQNAGSQNVLAVSAVDAHVGWIVGQYGTILKTMTSGLAPAPGSHLSCL